jgi:hypothetical protein
MLPSRGYMVLNLTAIGTVACTATTHISNFGDPQQSMRLGLRYHGDYPLLANPRGYYTG